METGPVLEAHTPASSEGSDIVLIADGWPKTVFLNLLNRGDLEGIQTHLIDEGSLLPNVVSNVPSVSIASHASILTGAPQSEHGIPGHRWADMDTLDCHNYLRFRGPRQVNRHLSPQVKTIFESTSRPHTLSVQSVVNRGAAETHRVGTLRAGPILRRLGQQIVQHGSSAAVAWLPRVDALCHSRGPDSLVVADEMRSTSHAIGKLVTALSKAGALEGSRIVLVPDHGQRPIDHGVDLRKELHAAGIDAAINPRAWTGRDFVAMTSGDGAAYLYRLGGEVSRAMAARIAESQNIGLVCLRGDGIANFLDQEGEGQLQWSGLTARYEAIAGNDPLGLTKPGSEIHFDLRDRLASGTGKYPDFLHQYVRSHVDGRSSSVLLFAARHTNFQTGPRPGYRMGFHRGTHGGPYEEDVVVAGAVRGWRAPDGVEPIRSAELLSRLGMLSATPEVNAVGPGQH